MADRFSEQPVLVEPVKAGRTPIEVASRIMANPDHPQYTADKAIAKELAGGRSGLIAAIDGVGSGGETSVKAAEMVQRNLNKIEIQLAVPPTINQAVVLLKNSIFAATAQVQELQKVGVNFDADTTVSAGIVCESPDGQRRFLVTANVGDSRIYRYRSGSGDVDQLTTDDSLVQQLVKEGKISPDEAFTHSKRNIITRAVGSLKTPKDIDFTVTEIQNGDIFLAVSDGVSDNLTPKGLPVAVRTEFQAAYDGSTKKPDLQKFASGLAQRARNIQIGTKAVHAKPDDICVAVLKVPRVK